VTQPLTALAAGHVFDPIQFTITAADARAYREAVLEQLPSSNLPRRLVPPLAVAALALGKLLAQVELPPGSLHASESLEFYLAIQEDSDLECRARLSQRSVRAGWVVSVLDTDIRFGGKSAVSARARVLSPLATQ
jgi:hypothetical protein